MQQRKSAATWPRDCAVTAGILVLCTLVNWLFFSIGFVFSDFILMYILGIVCINVFTSELIYGVVASLFSVLAVNYIFIDPYMMFHIRPEDMVTTLVMLSVSLLCSSLTERIKMQAAQSERKAYASQVLLEASRSLLGAEDTATILQATAAHLGKLLERPVYFAPAPETAGSTALVLPPPGQEEYSRCTALNTLSTYERNMTLSILDTCALALEKEQSNKTRHQAEEDARQEQLRSNLLRSISHDLRTPLTSISGNALILTEDNPLLTDEKRRELSNSIYEDANWLNHLVENLLAITRMENGQVNLRIQPELVQEIFDDVLTHLDRDSVHHTITTRLADDLLMANMDAQLIEQVLVNLVNNAIKYTPEHSHIELSAVSEGKFVRICVTDDGPGVPEETRSRLFEMFYTLGKTRSDGRRGLGLGLALCRSIVAAHGGTIDVQNVVPHGACFRFTLPQTEVTLHE